MQICEKEEIGRGNVQVSLIEDERNFCSMEMDESNGLRARNLANSLNFQKYMKTFSDIYRHL